MGNYSPQHGLGTLVTHVGEGDHPHHAHLSPIYQTSTFGFPDVATGADIMQERVDGYHYTRIANPNSDLLARKYAVLEGLDLLRADPGTPVDDIVRGRLFASGMAAISTAILARATAGQTVIAQEAIYGNAYAFLREVAPGLGLRVVWVSDLRAEGWVQALEAHPEAVAVYAETPSNPTLSLVDLAALAETAHRQGAWLIVDNTFATPYAQRPLALGADVVVHSTTKYLSGHGATVGGAVVSRHVTFVKQDLRKAIKLFGGSPSPFDAWLANLGLKTFELRMQRHCANAQAVVAFLGAHPLVAHVNYPGLESHPGYAIARRQMQAFGGMVSFELKGGFRAGETLMNSLRLITLAVSLGNVDSLIEHPASMTHRGVPSEEQRRAGITPGLVRFSVGIENIEDILADLDHGLSEVARLREG